MKGIVLIPLIIAVTMIVAVSTATYVLVGDKIQMPGFIKQSFSPLIKQTGKLGESDGLKVYQITGETEKEKEAEMPGFDFSEQGFWSLLKNMFSPGYFKQMGTPGQGEEIDESGFYQQTKQEQIVPPRRQIQERCFWEITREDLETLGLHCSQIAGYYYGPAIVGMFSDKYECNPVPGCQYDSQIVPFETKEECESLCGEIEDN